MKYLVVCASIILTSMLTGCGGGSGGNSSDDSISDLGTEAIYKFEGNGTTAINSSFDKMHGTIVGAIRVEGKVGKALSFESNNPSYVELNILSDNINEELIIDFPDNQISIEGWYKLSDFNNADEYYVLGSRNNGLNPFDLVFYNGNFKLTLFKDGYSDNSVDVIESDYEFEKDVWYYVSITYDGDIARLYIDGIENTSNAIITPVSRAYNDLFLGGVPPNGNTDSFPGAIDEFKLLQGVRSQTEILEYLDSLIQ
ncbi:LamG domain-containing protein [Litoribrevibacter euphylliae]|uniref:LamG domain-containing protein n=1 Tax=Litoribrevibacter euphylliae TaxID=1834034 RepID=A0ABV7HAQ2_9GAMM